jgi:peptidyl-prolyl cis-trans isomerase C
MSVFLWTCIWLMDSTIRPCRVTRKNDARGEDPRLGFDFLNLRSFPVKVNLIAATLAIVACAGAVVVAQTSAPASGPASTSAPATTSAPTSTSAPSATAGLPAVLATVNGVPITAAQVQKIIDMIQTKQPIPAEQMGMACREIARQLVQQEVMVAFIDSKNLEVPEADLKEQKDLIAKEAATEGMSVEQFMDVQGLTEQRMKTQVSLMKLIKALAAKDKIDAFLLAHPDYFNGTKLTASHILVLCQPFADSAEQAAAKAKIDQALADIQAGKMTFEEAAKKISDDSASAAKGGDLGEFTFDKMVPPFAVAAFAAKVDEISPVIRTPFGFHILKVTKRTEGTETYQDDVAGEIARKALMLEIQNELFDYALNKCKIEIAPEMKEPKIAPEADEESATQPATEPATMPASMPASAPASAPAE